MRDADTPPLLRLSPARAVVAVAWPMVAVGLLKTSYFLTDTWFVAQLGEEALAAAGGTAFAWWMAYLACEVAGTGTHALVARHVGAGDAHRIGETVVQGLWVGAAASVGVMALWPWRGGYFDALGLFGAERAFGEDLLGAVLLGCVAHAAHAVVDAAFRGLGETRTSLVLMIATLILNVVLAPALIWGVGPVPALGIAGAAWATSAARGFGALLGAVVLAGRGHPLRAARPDREVTRTIFRIGLPVSARGIAFSLVYVALGRLITSFGPENMAALGVGHRIEGLAYQVCVGFEIAAATLVGQHLGARDPAGALRAANTAARVCAAAVVPIGLALFVGAAPFYGVFADDPTTLDAGVLYLRLQTLVFAFMALEAVYEGAFSGSGDTLPPLWIGATGTVLRLPIAWALAVPLGFGIAGVWAAIAGSTVLKGVALWAWFQRGRWVGALGDPAPQAAAAP